MHAPARPQLDRDRTLPRCRIVSERLDHSCLNDTLDFNPTAENIARWICDNVANCYRVEVQESEGNTAAYEKD